VMRCIHDLEGDCTNGIRAEKYRAIITGDTTDGARTPTLKTTTKQTGSYTT